MAKNANRWFRVLRDLLGGRDFGTWSDPTAAVGPEEATAGEQGGQAKGAIRFTRRNFLGVVTTTAVAAAAAPLDPLAPVAGGIAGGEVLAQSRIMEVLAQAAGNIQEIHFSLPSSHFGGNLSLSNEDSGIGSISLTRLINSIIGRLNPDLGNNDYIIQNQTDWMAGILNEAASVYRELFPNSSMDRELFNRAINTLFDRKITELVEYLEDFTQRYNFNNSIIGENKEAYDTAIAMTDNPNAYAGIVIFKGAIGNLQRITPEKAQKAIERRIDHYNMVRKIVLDYVLENFANLSEHLEERIRSGTGVTPPAKVAFAEVRVIDGAPVFYFDVQETSSFFNPAPLNATRLMEAIFPAPNTDTMEQNSRTIFGYLADRFLDTVFGEERNTRPNYEDLASRIAIIPHSPVSTISGRVVVQDPALVETFLQLALMTDSPAAKEAIYLANQAMENLGAIAYSRQEQVTLEDGSIKIETVNGVHYTPSEATLAVIQARNVRDLPTGAGLLTPETRALIAAAAQAARSIGNGFSQDSMG